MGHVDLFVVMSLVDFMGEKLDLLRRAEPLLEVLGPPHHTVSHSDFLLNLSVSVEVTLVSWLFHSEDPVFPAVLELSVSLVYETILGLVLFESLHRLLHLLDFFSSLDGEAESGVGVSLSEFGGVRPDTLGELPHIFDVFQLTFNDLRHLRPFLVKMKHLVLTLHGRDHVSPDHRRGHNSFILSVHKLVLGMVLSSDRDESCRGSDVGLHHRDALRRPLHSGFYVVRR
jgi:hypothetical protein